MLCRKFQLVLLTVVLSISAVQSAPALNADSHMLVARANNTAAGNNNSTGAAGNNNSTGAAGNNGNNGNNDNNNKGNNGVNVDNGDPQKSRILNPKVIAAGFANNGQGTPTAGQVASLTSTNNFINFCLTVPNLPITNGKQISTGSCNPAPMGILPSTANMPSCKFSFPPNLGTIKANTAFTVKMNIRGMQTGFFVNAQENYFAAPQQLNGQGQIQGHSHVVIEQLKNLQQTDPTDPTKFSFFKGLNNAANNGELTADVSKGLPAGVYKVSSINTAANHQPVLVPVAQHGSVDDVVYFTVTADGQPAAGSGTPPAGGASNSTAASGASNSTSAATPSGTPAGNNNSTAGKN